MGHRRISVAKPWGLNGIQPTFLSFEGPGKHQGTAYSDKVSIPTFGQNMAQIHLLGAWGKELPTWQIPITYQNHISEITPSLSKETYIYTVQTLYIYIYRDPHRDVFIYGHNTSI